MDELDLLLPTGRRPTLLGVWAHPDDETYLSATLMQRVVARGGRVMLVCATRGELGSDDPGVDPLDLAARRERELRQAMAHLGVHDVWVLGHPDGACADVDTDVAVAPLVTAIAGMRPDLVVTFGPDGITNHPDHVAVGRWTTSAWLASPPSRRGHLLYATMTHDTVDRHRCDYPELPLTVSGTAVSIPDGDVALRVAPDAGEARRKRDALASHRSQVGGLVALLGEERFHDWWRVEHFREPTEAELGVAAGEHTAATRLGSHGSVELQRA